jgi:hypothetical protein
MHFVDHIFRQPAFLYQHVEPDLPANIQDILIRFNNALAANKEWFMEYEKTWRGKPLPYNERFGISVTEYQQLQTMEKRPPWLVPVDTLRITVLRDSGYIRFRTDSGIHLLDYLQIDLKKGMVLYGGDTIPFTGPAGTASGPYGEWHGYTWRLERADAAATLGTGHVTARVIEIDMGLTPAGPKDAKTQTGAPEKTFLRIKYQDMRDDITTANLELGGYVL